MEKSRIEASMMKVTINIQFVPFNKIIMKNIPVEVKYRKEEKKVPIIYASPQTTGITRIELQSQEDVVDKKGLSSFEN